MSEAHQAISHLLIRLNYLLTPLTIPILQAIQSFSFHVNCLDINIQNMNIKNQYIIPNYLYIFLFFSANIHVMNNYHHKLPHQHLIIHIIVTIKFIK